MSTHRTLCATIIFICSMLTSTNAMAGSESLKKVSSFFGSKPHENVIQKEYRLGKQPLLEITNLHGTIHVTGNNTDTVKVKAIIKSNAKENSTSLQPTFKQTAAHRVQITTPSKNESPKGTITLHVSTPKTTELKLKTNDTLITADHINAPTQATTEFGSIELSDMQSTVQATAKKRGNITVRTAKGPVKTETMNGTITITDSHNDVIAKTTKGKIVASCANLPSTSTIDLSSNSGNIQLTLPASINTVLQAKTDQGILTCELPITLNPLTTPLNAKAWTRLKREADGILGTGEAHIKLHTHHGSIKILRKNSP